jgi:hypothetical protein
MSGASDLKQKFASSHVRSGHPRQGRWCTFDRSNRREAVSYLYCLGRLDNQCLGSRGAFARPMHRMRECFSESVYDAFRRLGSNDREE